MAKPIRQAFFDLTGKSATDRQMQRIMAAASALDVRAGDPTLLMFMLLEHYHGIFEEAPRRIEASVDASIEAVKASADSAALGAQAAVTKAVASLVPSVQKTIAEAAQEVVLGIQFGHWMPAVWGAMVVIGLVFALGWLFGSSALTALNTQKLSSDSFWQFTSYGIGAGVCAPALFVTGLLIRKGKTQLALAGSGSLLLAGLLYKLVMLKI